ncbi:hypothetical protein [Paucibacter soli]|uniref:hypothetical protein n=1 Tax=Paucibacter soli TaxID=3133433 RepID=UPI0030A5B798
MSNIIESKNSQPLVSGPGRVIGVRLAAGVAALGILALLAPLIWGAVSAGAGLVVLGALAAIGIGAFQALPYLGQKWENKLLALRKLEARQNPIEQLQNYLMERRSQVNNFKEAVKLIGAQIKSLADMIDDRVKKKPGYDATRQMQSVQAMREAHEKLVTKYKNAEAALGELQERIEDKKFEWSFSQAGQAAMRSLNSTSGQDLLNEMLADEAFSSVRDNFNSVFADLELEAVRLSSEKQLTFGSETLDLSAISIPQLDRVKA